MPSTRRRTAVLAVALTLTAAVLAACGSSKNAPEDDAGTPSTTPTDATGDGGPIVLQGVGDPVTLDEPATTVVAIQWSHVEDLLALGVTPAGVADIEGYGTWVRSDPAIPDGVTDIGDRQAPSIERIRGLAPDLIIAGEDVDPDAADTMRDIAPVLVLDDYPDEGGSAFETMETTFRTIAAATGTEAKADEVMTGLTDRIADGKAELEAADLRTRTVVLVQGDGTVDSPLFRLFNDQALVVEIMEQLGLENGWDGPDEGYGFNTVSMEALTSIEDSWFLSVVQPTDLDAFLDRFADSPLWTSLPFVRDDLVKPLGGDVWFFGGPLSAEYFVDQLIATLVA